MLKDPIERAWEYHAAADTLLLGRVQTLFIGQSLLAVPFALFYIRLIEDGMYLPVVLVFPVVAIAISIITIFKTKNLAAGMNILKCKYLRNDEVYNIYLTAVNESSDWKRHIYVYVIPIVFIFMWIVLLAISIST